MQIDARGKKCPQPVVMAIKGLEKLSAEGRACEDLEVLVDEEVAVNNLRRLASSKKREVSVAQADGHSVVTIAGGEPVEASGLAGQADDEGGAERFAGATVLVGTDTLGHGNEELGKILIKGLIYALSQSDVVPAKMIFFNGGAHLTCEGSASLDDIKELSERGCEVLTCGTCLDYYKLTDKLAVGGVTNLYVIGQQVVGPNKVVSLA